jgi:hypothetical protein
MPAALARRSTIACAFACGSGVSLSCPVPRRTVRQSGPFGSSRNGTGRQHTPCCLTITDAMMVKASSPVREDPCLFFQRASAYGRSLTLGRDFFARFRITSPHSAQCIPGSAPENGSGSERARDVQRCCVERLKSALPTGRGSATRADKYGDPAARFRKAQTFAHRPIPSRRRNQPLSFKGLLPPRASVRVEPSCGCLRRLGRGSLNGSAIAPKP